MNIFISHSEKDKVIADAFVDLLVIGANINKSNIFCSSRPGTGIKKGEDFVLYIGDKLKNSDIVFVLFSQNFIESEFCIAELGAVWYSNKDVIPILIRDDIKFKETTDLFNHISGLRINEEKIDDEDENISEIANIVQKHGITIDISEWNKKRKQFIKRIEKQINEPILPSKIKYEEYIKNTKEISKLKEEIENLNKLIEEKNNIIKRIENAQSEKEVSQIIHDINKTPQNVINDFESICEKASYILSKYSSALQYILFKHYRIEDVVYSEVNKKYNGLDDAIESNYVDYDPDLRLNENEPIIKKGLETINELKDFIDIAPAELFTYVEEQYGISLDIQNKNFWNYCLGTRI